MTSFVVCQKAYFELIGNRCAAELLYFFKQQRQGWFIITIEELRNKFFGVWGKDAIRRALALLDELNMVARRHTRLNGRAWEYKFVTDNPTTVVEESPTVIDNPTTVVEESPTVIDNPTTVVEESPTTYIQDPILDHLEDPNYECGDEEMSEEEIKAALAHLGEEPNSADTACQLEPTEKPQKKLDLTPFFERLRAIEVPLSGRIRELLSKQQSKQQLHNNITALEEEAAKNGLKNPIASCIAAIKRNWQPRMDAQLWWDAAANNLGRERRDKLIQNVTKLATPEGRQEVFVIFKTGRMLKLTEAYSMGWDAIAAFGGGAP